MRKVTALLVFSLGLSTAGAAHAELWRILPTAFGAVAYDEHSIRADLTSGDAMVDVVVFNAQPQVFEGTVYQYMAARQLFRCRGDAYRRSRQLLIDQAGAGRQIPDTDWLPIDLGAASAFRNIACTTARPPSTAEAPDMLALLPAMVRAHAAPRPGPAAQAAPAASSAPNPAQPAADPGPRLRPSGE